MPEGWLARQVAAITRNVHTRNHSFFEALGHERADLFDNAAHGYATVIAARKGDNAERATMIAALLHLDKSAGAAIEALNQVLGGFAYGHNIASQDRHSILGHEALALHFVFVTDHACHFRHGGVGFGFQLRRASCGNNCRGGVVALEAADGLLALTFGFFGDSAGVDDDGVGQAHGGGVLAHHFRFVRIQPTAKVDHLNAGIFAHGIHDGSAHTPSKT